MEISRKVKQDLLLQLLMKAFVCNQVHSRRRNHFDIYISFNNNVNFFTLRTFDSWSFYSAKFKLDHIGPGKNNAYSIKDYSKIKILGKIAVKCKDGEQTVKRISLTQSSSILLSWQMKVLGRSQLHNRREGPSKKTFAKLDFSFLLTFAFLVVASFFLFVECMFFLSVRTLLSTAC